MCMRAYECTHMTWTCLYMYTFMYMYSCTGTSVRRYVIGHISNATTAEYRGSLCEECLGKRINVDVAVCRDACLADHVVDIRVIELLAEVG